MSTFLHKTSNLVWLRRAHYRFFTWDKEVLIIYICIDFKSLKHIYVPKSRDCVNLYFLDRVKNIFGCVNVHSDYPLALLQNWFPQSWLREISSLQFSILVLLSSLVLWIESYSIYSLCFSSHPGVQNFLWQQKAQSPKQTENSSPKIKQLPVNSGIFYRNVPSPSICYTFKRTHCSI